MAAQILYEIFALFLDISSFCFYIYNRVKLSPKVNIFYLTELGEQNEESQST